MSKNTPSDSELQSRINRLTSSTHSPQGHFGAQSGWEQLEKKLSSPKQRRLIPYKYISAAAAFALLIGCSWMFYLYLLPVEMLTIQTFAETKEVLLPDGTEVTLNHYTTLTYPKGFKGDDHREVHLKGEAYFEVNKNPQRPFIVKTEQINVQVLGTHFNVSAYRSEADVTTTLLEGSVAVTTKNETERLILKPGETAVYNKCNQRLSHVIMPVAVDEIAWKQGVLVFNTCSLSEIAATLSRQFGQRIVVSDDSLKVTRLTARFANNENLDEILRLLQSVGNFTTRTNNQTIELKRN